MSKGWPGGAATKRLRAPANPRQGVVVLARYTAAFWPLPATLPAATTVLVDTAGTLDLGGLNQTVAGIGGPQCELTGSVEIDSKACRLVPAA